MNVVKKILIAGAFAISAATPAAAITNAEVLDAITDRTVEMAQQITALRGEIAAETDPVARAALIREAQILNVRRGQLISLSRVVPRYNERFLVRIVTFFDLDVSLA